MSVAEGEPTRYNAFMQDGVADLSVFVDGIVCQMHAHVVDVSL